MPTKEFMLRFPESFRENSMHYPSAKDKVNHYGFRFATLNPLWHDKAQRILADIEKTPDNGELFIEAIELGARVFNDLVIFIPENHRNADNLQAFFMDTYKHHILGEYRMMPVSTWETLFERDDRSGDDELDMTRLNRYRIRINFVDLASRSRDGVVDMLCTIAFLSKLLQK